MEIPYIGGSLAMTVIVPDDLAAFEQALTADQLAAITGALAETQVSLTFPKFSIETKAELADVLAALGHALRLRRPRRLLRASRPPSSS